jgi:hypothetical protein
MREVGLEAADAELIMESREAAVAEIRANFPLGEIFMMIISWII